MLHYYENDYAVYEIKESILYITYKEDLVIDYQAAQIIVHDRLSIQSYKSYLILCDVSSVRDITLEAREYLAIYGSTLTKAVALVSHSPSLSSLSKYFLIINQPTAITLLFSDTHSAETYLKEFLNEIP